MKTLQLENKPYIKNKDYSKNYKEELIKKKKELLNLIKNHKKDILRQEFGMKRDYIEKSIFVFPNDLTDKTTKGKNKEYDRSINNSIYYSLKSQNENRRKFVFVKLYDRVFKDKK